MPNTSRFVTLFFALGLAGCGTDNIDLLDGISRNKPGKTCESQGKSYEPGATFKSPDGCNDCSCQSDGTIVCTLRACEEPPKPCTTIGCFDQFSVTATIADADLPRGTHEINAYTAEGGPVLSCTLEVPAQIGPGGVTGSCTGGLTAFITPQQKCTEATPNNGSSSSRCEPVPGAFRETISLKGTPAKILIIQRAGGKTLINRLVEPAYRDVSPNGPSCGPVCRQGTLDLTVPSLDPPPAVACAPSPPPECRTDASCVAIGKTTCTQPPLTSPCVGSPVCR